MCRYRSIVSIVLSLFVVFVGGCSQNPVDTKDNNNGDDVVTVGFNVSGKLVDKDGKPIVGAKAVLSQSGLFAISNANGEYKIQGQGTLRKSLAKTVANADSGTTDTLVVTVANEQGSKDSSEVIKQVVTSGIVMELPTTYIVQREIRGYLSPDDAKQISRIEAVLFDVAVPDQQKHIDLWHDTLNKAFHSFAYFSSATNKTYTLYVKVYDMLNHYVGRSPDFSFPDQAGNIVFTNPFNWSNAKPTISVDAPVTVAMGTDSTKITVTAIDSLGGQIVSCKVNLDGIHIVTVPRNSVLSRKTVSATGSNVDTYVGAINIPLNQYDSSKTVAIATDNDGNVSQEVIKMNIVNQQASFNTLFYVNGSSFRWVYDAIKDDTYGNLTVGDSLEVKQNFRLDPDPQPTISKIEWFWNDNVIHTGATFSLKIPASLVGTGYLSIKVTTDKGVFTSIKAKFIISNLSNVTDTSKDTAKITMPNTMVIRDVNVATGVVSIAGIELYKPIQKSEYSIDGNGWVTFDYNKAMQIPWPTTAGTHTCTFKIVASSGQEFTKSVQKTVQ